MQLESQEKNMEIILHVCEEAYLIRAAGLFRENHCIDTASHSFIQYNFIEQLLVTTHYITCESWIKVNLEKQTLQFGLTW